jgi:hypothetical protein
MTNARYQHVQWSLGSYGLSTFAKVQIDSLLFGLFEVRDPISDENTDSRLFQVGLLFFGQWSGPLWRGLKNRNRRVSRRKRWEWWTTEYGSSNSRNASQ